MTSRPTDHIHVGMRALSADGAVLGTVCRLIVLDAYLFVELVPTAARWKRWTRPRHLFVPMSCIAAVEPDHLVLTLDARSAQVYTARPEWTGHGTERATGTAPGRPWDGGNSGGGVSDVGAEISGTDGW